MADNIPLYRGDNFSQTITVLDENLDPIDITAANITFSVKADLADAGYSFQCTTAGGDVVITDGPNGVFRVDIAPADTQSLDAAVYYWDAQITTAGGKVYTVPRTPEGLPEIGTLTLTAEATRP